MRKPVKERVSEGLQRRSLSWAAVVKDEWGLPAKGEKLRQSRSARSSFGLKSGERRELGPVLKGIAFPEDTVRSLRATGVRSFSAAACRLQRGEWTGGQAMPAVTQAAGWGQGASCKTPAKEEAGAGSVRRHGRISVFRASRADKCF